MDKGKQHKRKNKRMRYNQIFQWKYKEEHGTAKKGHVAATSQIKRRFWSRYGQGRLALWKKKFFYQCWLEAFCGKLKQVIIITRMRRKGFKTEVKFAQVFQEEDIWDFESGSPTVTTLKECWICLNVARNLWTWMNLKQSRSLGFSQKEVGRI